MTIYVGISWCLNELNVICAYEKKDFVEEKLLLDKLKDTINKYEYEILIYKGGEHIDTEYL